MTRGSPAAVAAQLVTKEVCPDNSRCCELRRSRKKARELRRELGQVVRTGSEDQALLKTITTQLDDLDRRIERLKVKTGADLRLKLRAMFAREMRSAMLALRELERLEHQLKQLHGEELHALDAATERVWVQTVTKCGRVASLVDKYLERWSPGGGAAPQKRHVIPRRHLTTRGSCAVANELARMALGGSMNGVSLVVALHCLGIRVNAKGSFLGWLYLQRREARRLGLD